MAEAGEKLEGTVERIVFRAPDGAFAVVRVHVSGRPHPATVIGPLARTMWSVSGAATVACARATAGAPSNASNTPSKTLYESCRGDI